MPLSAGSRLGPYEIIERIGAGGMGEVYRAKDIKLGRDVAVKVLPASFTSDPERVARFRREAQVLAALNHPNIAHLYGLDETDSTHFLVMELVDGESLDKRIARGPIPLDDALSIARQIAEALEAAHEKGIIHRDLKPANVALTKDGNVKVLDFGLAKTMEVTGTPSSFDAAASPTLTSPAMMTGVGVILGTAAYMSPEQLKGRPADKRSDIWAFGCVLFEMLTGRTTFGHSDVAETLGAVLKVDPNWTLLPRGMRASVGVLLRRSLEKTATERISDFGTVRFLLSDSWAASMAAPTRPIRWTLIASLALLTMTAAGVVFARRQTPVTDAPRTATRFAVMLPADVHLFDDLGFQSLAFAPDGRRLVFVGSTADSSRLYVRDLDQMLATPIRGTEGAQCPFFSPDGQWIGFFAGGKLQKVSVGGGSAQTLTLAPSSPQGGSWRPDDMIIYATGNNGLFQIAAAGGTAHQLTTPDGTQGETAHHWPELLPGGRAVLFTAQRGIAQRRVMIRDLATGRHRVLDPNGGNPHYIASGHLVFARAGSLFAAPFDLRAGQTTGPAVPVLDGVVNEGTSGVAQAAMAANGSLAYVPGAEVMTTRTVVWVDRHGVEIPLLDRPRPYREVHISPDGQRIAVGIDGVPRDLWIYDIKRGTLSRFTFEPTESEFATWSADGTRIAFGALRPEKGHVLRWKLADGTGPEEEFLVGGPRDHFHPASWSRDGFLAYTNATQTETANDIWILPPNGKTAIAFAATKFNERSPVFSPNGRFVAYVSDESGRDEVYVRAYPGSAGKWQVSVDGGAGPIWASDGRELFFGSGDRIMAVGVTTDGAFTAGTPRALFAGHFERPAVNLTNFDVAPDGQRFLMLKRVRPSTTSEIDVVLDWTSELTRLVPATK